MRILICTQHRAVVGGVETYLRDLLPALALAGHSLALVCECTDAAGDRAIDAGVPGVPVSGVDAGMESFVRDFRPDVVYDQGLLDSEAESWLSRSAPTLLYAHIHGGNCISGTKRHSRPREAVCERRFGLACLLHYLPRGCGGSNPLTMLNLYRQQSRRRGLWPTFRGIAVAGRYMFDELRRNGVEERRLHRLPLFPSGIAPDPEALQRVPGGELLFLGRLTALKGAIHAVRALAILRASGAGDYRLTVVGDGAERGSLEAFARDNALPVTFVGSVDFPRRNEFLRSADLLVVPSVWGEPFGLVGIAAGCVGVPAAGFDAGGVADWLIPGETGELAPADPPDPRGLADAIRRALADPVHYNALRVGAWRLAREHSLALHVERLETLLESCLEPEST